MATHARTPDMAHQALVHDVHDVLGRYGGMPKIEQMAILSQVIGQMIAEIPTGQYGTGEVMAAIALNIQSGNESTARSIASAIQGARGV